MPSCICKCDKPLEPLSIVSHLLSPCLLFSLSSPPSSHSFVPSASPSPSSVSNSNLSRSLICECPFFLPFPFSLFPSPSSSLSFPLPLLLFLSLCSSVYLSICTQTFPFTNILHSYFVEQLTYISPFNMPSSICECDKPLEPLSTCPTYSCYFYPLQLFLPFHIYPNLSIHKYPLSISVE